MTYKISQISSPEMLKQVYTVGRWLGGEILELVCPACCEVCHTEIPTSREMICQICWEQLRQNLQQPACPVCGQPAGPYELVENQCHRCHGTRPAVSRTIRVGKYSDTLRDLILSFKFRGQSRLDRFLGQLMASAIMGSGTTKNIDLLVPVPLHWLRFLSRGYNQSELLAKETSRELRKQNFNIPTCCDLVRVRNTAPQVSLPAHQRKGNLRGAFATRPDADFAGKHICLIDDVTTTGTTLKTAARALKQAGAAKVTAAVITVAESG